jgi:hypothetical protein
VIWRTPSSQIYATSKFTPQYKFEGLLAISSLIDARRCVRAPLSLLHIGSLRRKESGHNEGCGRLLESRAVILLARRSILAGRHAVLSVRAQ